MLMGSKSISVLALISTFLIFSPQVFASTSTMSASPSAMQLPVSRIDPGALEVGDSLISPASSLYFLKALRERIELAMSSNTQMQSQRQLEFTVRRLREVKSLIEERREDLIPETLERYKDSLNQLNGISKNDEGLQEALGESIARHAYILQTLYYQTSDPSAKRAIRSAIEAVVNYNTKLLTNLENDLLRQQLTSSVGLRQIAACQFLASQTKASELNDAERVILKDDASKCLADVTKNFQPQLQDIESGK